MRGRSAIAGGGAALAFLALTSGSGCRKAPPDEIVYTGMTRPGAVNGSPSAPVNGPAAEVPSGGDASNAVPSAPIGAGSEAPASPEPVEPPAPMQSACVAPATSAAAFSKLGLIEAAGDCAIWHYCVFAERSRVLESEAIAHRSVDSEAARRAVSLAFASAMSAWQAAELFRFGPSARSNEPGGQDLRDLIYAWPVQPECKVDEQTVSQVYRSPEFHSLDFGLSPVNGRTLAALEYLLFGSAEQNHCSQFSLINSSGSWAALSASEVATRRRAYAAEVSVDVRARAEQLTRAWSADGENFRARLLASGPGGDPFTSEQQALNAISNALFYLDLELKDDKLGTPLGLAPECTASVCPDAVESTYTELSLEYIRQNVLGFRRLFEGCGPDYAGLGFDDWLRDVGAAELADRMLAGLVAIDQAIERVPVHLAQALVTDRTLPLGVYDAVKVVTDELKTEFVTVLNLELPAAAEGDND